MTEPHKGSWGELLILLVFGLLLLIPAFYGERAIDRDATACEQRGGVYVRAHTKTGFVCITRLGAP